MPSAALVNEPCSTCGRTQEQAENDVRAFGNDSLCLDCCPEPDFDDRDSTELRMATEFYQGRNFDRAQARGAPF